MRVVLVAEQSVIRAGLRSILTSTPELRVVSSYGDTKRAKEGSRHDRPEVILVGTREGLAADAAAARQLVSADAASGAKAILLHPAETSVEVSQVLTGGVHGCIDPAMDEEQIIRAVTAVAMGGAVFLPAPKVQQAEQMLAIEGPSPAEARLTEREHAVLGGLARGLSNSEIGTELFLAEATVKKHLTQAMRKIGQPDRLRAGLYAYQHGIFR
ncbi:response regulator transcription factor [Streptomyces alanosinicus]|uniref:response regulator transcription factor n=1 Tax=Streptomyces alanosinicus TaxID=68171 RepID=UPI00167ADF92|nr:response regulator transcription factor [Streptomyces alanosinicus]